MARLKRKGAFYFSLAVDFFKNRKIRVLLGKYGADGVILYLYILCEIYASGYYLKIDDDFQYIVAQDLNMSSDKTGQIINFLCKRSLLDDKLFTSDKVLTSHRIQTSFQEINKVRGIKTPLEVDEKYWLLSEEETQPFIKVINFKDFSEKKDNFSKKNDDFSKKNDTKKSKEKENKIEENNKSKERTSRFTPPTLNEVKEYCKERNNNVDAQRFIDYYTSNGWFVGKNKMKDWKAAVRTWESNGYNSNAILGTSNKNSFQNYNSEVSDFEVEIIKRRIEENL